MSRAEGSGTNLTCVISCPGDRDVTAMTADVSHVELQHSESVSGQATRGRGREQAEKHVSDRDRLKLWSQALAAAEALLFSNFHVIWFFHKGFNFR